MKPRERVQAFRPIIAVSQEHAEILIEATGEIFPLAWLPGILASNPSSLLVTMNAASLLYELDKTCGEHPAWQYRVSPNREIVTKPNNVPVGRIQGTVIHFLGWRPGDGRKAHYHYPIDPVLFSRKGINELLPGPEPHVLKLMRWGQDVRSWCEEQGLRVSTTNGGLAGQLLRDSRWFPNARRKVPTATNGRARLALPGNYYRLFCDVETPYSATYLDMKNAHHNIAARLTLPDPNTLYARGQFRVTGETDVTVPANTPWHSVGTSGYNQVLAMHGLVYCHLTVPHLKKTAFAPPYMVVPGRKMVWLWTNEIPMVKRLGGIIDWVTAGWLSPDTSTGINGYALWAMKELDTSTAERKRWLKPSLLSTYGVLAARPHCMEFGFKQAKTGVPRKYPAGPGMLETIALVGTKEREMPTVNVIYRGMIEAQQRMEALALARDLHQHGHNVLAIYADSVFVEAGEQLPFLPNPWVVEQELDALQFLSSTSFTSAQLTKLPGIPRDSLDRLRWVEQGQSAWNAYRPLN